MRSKMKNGEVKVFFLNPIELAKKSDNEFTVNNNP